MATAGRPEYYPARRHAMATVGMIRTEVDNENPLNAMGWDAVQCFGGATGSNIPGAIGAG